jgi:hypothetical protein
MCCSHALVIVKNWNSKACVSLSKPHLCGNCLMGALYIAVWLQQAKQRPSQLAVVVMLLQGVDHQGYRRIAQLEVQKKNGMLTTLCVLTIRSLCFPVHRYDGEVSYWESQLATVCGEIKEHIYHKISKKAPTYAATHCFFQNNNCVLCIERERGPTY